MTVDEQTAPVDGRTARGLRTREKVVDALLALQEEGDLSPTAQRVAARAGVALRTVFGHFSDMESLYAEAGQRELAKLVELAEPVDPTAPLEQRIAAYTASRARVLEALLPVMRASRLKEPTSLALQEQRRVFISVGDEEVREAFGPELAAHDGPAQEAVLHGLYLVSSAIAWEALRTDRGLSPEAAVEVVARGVRAALSD
jgi:TetR/AcrR family transcriptional regulator, regulator of autoinduction and epiphytic fitness